MKSDLGLTPDFSLRKKLRMGSRDPAILFALVLCTVITLIFIIFPLAKLIWTTFWVDGNFSLAKYGRVLNNEFHRRTILNSLLLGGTVTITSLIIAGVFAFGVARKILPFRRLFQNLVLLPMVAPPFVFALASILLLGRRGLVTWQWLGLNTNFLYGFNGLVIVQTLTFFPVAYLVLVGLIEALDHSLEAAGENLGASPTRVFFTITVPLLTPGVASAGLLVFIQSLADFGNPAILGGNYRVLSEQVYVQFVGGHDPATGTILALGLLTVSLAAFLLQKYWMGQKSFITVTGKPASKTETKISAPIKIFVTIFCTLITLIILGFYISIVSGSFFKLWGINHTWTLEHYKHIFSRGINSLKNSTKLALIAAPVATLIGTIAALLFVRERFKGKRILEFAMLLTFAVPGTVLGISFILAFNVPPLLLTGTGTILVLALVIRNMPMAIQSSTSAIHQIDPAIEEASVNLGASRQKTIWKITAPLIRPALFSGLVNSFVQSMTAVSAIVFLISARWPLITSSILMQVEEGRFSTAAAFSVLLIGVVFIAIFIANRLVYWSSTKEADIN